MSDSSSPSSQRFLPQPLSVLAVSPAPSLSFYLGIYVNQVLGGQEETASQECAGEPARQGREGSPFPRCKHRRRFNNRLAKSLSSCKSRCAAPRPSPLLQPQRGKPLPPAARTPRFCRWSQHQLPNMDHIGRFNGKPIRGRTM